MELLRPKTFSPEKKIIFTQGTDFEYHESIFDLTMKKSINILTIADFSNNYTTIDLEQAMEMPNNDIVIKYASMQTLIKICVDNAEEIKNSLQQLYVSKTKPETNEEKKMANEIDFMNLRDWYMKDIRDSKIYLDFKEYNSTKKLKPFSSAFNDFILDRNIYTHGQLCIVRRSWDFLIQYIDKKSNGIRYAIIDSNILKSYNDCYDKIRMVMREYNVIHQNKLLEIESNKQNA